MGRVHLNTRSPEINPSPRWTPENDQTVNNYINDALKHTNGNIENAFAYLRDKRDQPSNYYDTNLAIAADYLRARWDTERHGPDAENEAIDKYMALKQRGLVPKEGPGPVSPYSEKEKAYMHKGVQDEAKHMPPEQIVYWNTREPHHPLTRGEEKALKDATWGSERGVEKR